MNYCVVKYIHLKDLDPEILHTVKDYEYRKAIICHDSYDAMVEMVSSRCPDGFTCIHPITLHHEVLWITSLVANPRGEVSTDHLFQPIDSSDYAVIQWNKTADSSMPMLSICVQIQQQCAILS